MSVQDRPYLLDTRTARTLLLADAPTELRYRVRHARFGSLWMSAVTEGELRSDLHHLAPQEPLREALELLFRNIPTVPFDRSGAIAYAVLCRHPALPPQACELEVLVAAHAISLEATLITPVTTYSAITEIITENWLVS